MLNLKEDAQSAFMEGEFTVQKTNQKFSKIGLGHNHEQLNGNIKGLGGATGLMKNDSNLQDGLWRVQKPLALMMNLNIMLVSINSKTMSNNFMIRMKHLK